MPSSSAWKWVNEVRSWVNQSWETPPHDATHSPPTPPLPYRDPFNRGDVLQNKQIGAPHIPEDLSSSSPLFSESISLLNVSTFDTHFF